MSGHQRDPAGHPTPQPHDPEGTPEGAAPDFAEFSDFAKSPAAAPDTQKSNAPNPFDPSSFRLGQSFGDRVGVKKLLSTVPVGKPNRQDFVRVHPDASRRIQVAIIDYERDFYLLVPEVAAALPNEFKAVTLYTAINRQGTVRLWPVPLPSPDGRQNIWHTSHAEAAETAQRTWVRVSANMSLGAYDVYQAAGTIPDPEWPDLPFSEILEIAFRGRILRTLDHPLVGKLNGSF